MVSDRETTKIKIVDPKKLWNFVVDNFFILIRLGSQILILKSDEHKMARTKISFGHKQLAGGVFRGWRHEAGGQEFEGRWPRGMCFSREKSCDLWLAMPNRVAVQWGLSQN